MPEPKRKLKNLDVQFISLVDKGANQRELIWKSREKPDSPGEAGLSDFSHTVAVRKVDQEKRLIYSIVYPPGESDAHGDTMEAAEIEKAAHNFLAKKRTDQVDKQHNEDPGEGLVVESYIIGKNDVNFPDDPAGSWAVVIKVVNDDTWEEVKKGEITGVSLGGWAETEDLTKQTKSQSPFKEFLQRMKDSFMSGKVDKDFAGKLMERQIMQGIYAFEDEVRTIMNDEQITDKKASILTTIDEFRAYVDGLKANKTQKQFKSSVIMSTEEKKTPDNKTDVEKEEKTAIEKSLDNIQKSVSDLKDTFDGKFEKLEKRLEAVEKAAPGRQSAEGQDEEEQETVTKGLKIIV